MPAHLGLKIAFILLADVATVRRDVWFIGENASSVELCFLVAVVA